MRLPTSNQ